MRVPLLLVLAALPAGAAAHGINGHVHVTGWAIENLPPGELRDFFADPEIREAAQIGASFPDSGYAIGDGYGELAHWEPFVDGYVRHLRARAPFDTPEERKQVAFLMGLAAHGLQDELFDSVFLHQVHEHDGPFPRTVNGKEYPTAQDPADPGTDAFLFTDGYLRFKPALFVPFDDVIAVMADVHGHRVERETIDQGMRRVKTLVIDRFHAIAPVYEREMRPVIPWTAANYMDPGIPGSLTSEIAPTGAYLQALWDRLHDRWPARAVVTHTWPEAPRRLRSGDPATVDSWITLVFGAGTINGSVNTETVRLLDAGGAEVPFSLHHTRWGGSPDDSSRLVQLRPTAPLAPDAEHTVRVEPGVRLQDGRVLDVPWTYTFRTPCADGQACADADAGAPDLWPPDAAPDAAAPDAASPDAAPPDAAVPDAAPSPPDAAARCGSGTEPHPDGGCGGIPRGPDASVGGAAKGDDGGCATAPTSGAAPLALLAGLACLRRRRRAP